MCSILEHMKKFNIISGFSEENRPKGEYFVTIAEYRKIAEDFISHLEESSTMTYWIETKTEREEHRASRA